MSNDSARNISWARWSLVGFLTAIAGGLLFALGVSVRPALGQPVAAEGNNQVFVVAGQISDETYGLYLVDYENKTICVYQYLPRDRTLSLMAARTYRYDAQLDNYNTGDPPPGEVKDLVEQHRRLGTQ